jgi:hypothetical protein
LLPRSGDPINLKTIENINGTAGAVGSGKEDEVHYTYGYI